MENPRAVHSAMQLSMVRVLLEAAVVPRIRPKAWSIQHPLYAHPVGRLVLTGVVDVLDPEMDAVPVAEVVVTEVELEKYTLRRFGPPHISAVFPLQVMVHPEVCNVP